MKVYPPLRPKVFEDAQPSGKGKTMNCQALHKGLKSDEKGRGREGSEVVDRGRRTGRKSKVNASCSYLWRRRFRRAATEDQDWQPVWKKRGSDEDKNKAQPGARGEGVTDKETHYKLQAITFADELFEGW